MFKAFLFKALHDIPTPGNSQGDVNATVSYDSAPITVRAKAENAKRLLEELDPDQPAEADLLSALRRIGITRKSSGTPDGKMQFFYVDDIKVDCVTYDMFLWLEDCREEEGFRRSGVSPADTFACGVVQVVREEVSRS